MAQVQLKINGHMHTVGCKDGEEAHLTAMGAEVEKRIEKVKALGMEQRRIQSVGDGSVVLGRRVARHGGGVGERAAG